mgnify:CR=1 FL=1
MIISLVPNLHAGFLLKFTSIDGALYSIIDTEVLSRVIKRFPRRSQLDVTSYGDDPLGKHQFVNGFFDVGGSKS